MKKLNLSNSEDLNNLKEGMVVFYHDRWLELTPTHIFILKHPVRSKNKTDIMLVAETEEEIALAILGMNPL